MPAQAQPAHLQAAPAATASRRRGCSPCSPTAHRPNPAATCFCRRGVRLWPHAERPHWRAAGGALMHPASNPLLLGRACACIESASACKRAPCAPHAGVVCIAWRDCASCGWIRSGTTGLPPPPPAAVLRPPGPQQAALQARLQPVHRAVHGDLQVGGNCKRLLFVLLGLLFALVRRAVHGGLQVGAS